MKLTRWFPGKTRPVRAGMYHVQDHNTRCNCCWSDARWDGKEWFSNLCSPPGRYTTHMLSGVRRWRGLAAPVASKEVA